MSATPDYEKWVAALKAALERTKYVKKTESRFENDMAEIAQGARSVIPAYMSSDQYSAMSAEEREKSLTNVLTCHLRRNGMYGYGFARLYKPGEVKYHENGAPYLVELPPTGNGV